MRRRSKCKCIAKLGRVDDKWLIELIRNLAQLAQQWTHPACGNERRAPHCANARLPTGATGVVSLSNPSTGPYMYRLSAKISAAPLASAACAIALVSWGNSCGQRV
jgi:hypothetical protein